MLILVRFHAWQSSLLFAAIFVSNSIPTENRGARPIDILSGPPPIIRLVVDPVVDTFHRRHSSHWLPDMARSQRRRYARPLRSALLWATGELFRGLGISRFCCRALLVWVNWLDWLIPLFL